MPFDDLLSQYGYLALFAGCLLEGETLLLLAGMAAHGGYLSYPIVVLIAFVGGTLGDQIGFFVGRHFGNALLARWPRFDKAVERTRALIDRHAALCVVGVRFMYGLRLVGPVVIGTSRVSAPTFLVFNALGAALWAVLVSGVGYLFGHAIDRLRNDLALFETVSLLLAVAIGVVAYLRMRARRKGP